jgi:hypothetical protein
MAFLEYFTNLNSNIKPFRFGFRTGDNALATLKNLNTLVDKINVVKENNGREIRLPFQISTPALGAPSIVSSNAWEVCEGTGTNCGTAFTKTYKCIAGCGTSFADFVNSGVVGVYTLTINYDATLPYITGTRILVGNTPSTTPTIVAVDKVSESVYTITVIDIATGLPVGGKLLDTYLDIVLEIDQSLVTY